MPLEVVRPATARAPPAGVNAAKAASGSRHTQHAQAHTLEAYNRDLT